MITSKECMCVFVVARCSRSLAGLALAMERTDGGQKRLSLSLAKPGTKMDKRV